MATTTTEVERKYEVPTDFVVPDLLGVPRVAAVAGPALLRLDATYYDTADLRLAGNRMTLRRRSGGHDAGWTLKRPAAADRTETQEPLTRNRNEVPTALIEAVHAVIGDRPLVPVVRIRTRRREWTVQDSAGATLALIADDTVTGQDLTQPVRTTRWRELEVELVDGPRTVIDRIEKVLRATGARRSDSPSKLAQALGDRYPSAAAAPPIEPDSGEVGEAARAVGDFLRENRDAIRDNEPLVRSEDADGVHDMRVAVRRLRSTLRTLRPLLDRQRTEPLRAELHWLAGLLGAVRDGDVLVRRVKRHIATIAARHPELIIGPVDGRIRERLAAEEARARTELVAALDGDRYADLLSALDALIQEPRPDVSRAKVLRHTRQALARADGHLERALHTDPAGTGMPLPAPVPADRDTALHEARKAYKRARYAVELATPLARTPAKRLGKRLGSLQDVLGDHQDAIVAARMLRDFGARAYLDGDNTFSYGLLYGYESNIAEQRLAALDPARRQANKRRDRRWLRS